MKRYISLIFIIFLLNMQTIWATDVATFVNMGFSNDGKKFMFGEHGYFVEEGKAYSNIYIVDTESNTFVPGGVFEGIYSANVGPSQSSDGAFLRLYEQTMTLKKNYSINHLQKGYPLYIRLISPVGEEKKGNDNKLSFLDAKGVRYSVLMDINQRGEGYDVQSSFNITLSRTNLDNNKEEYSIGHPNFWRPGVKDYKIQRILSLEGEKIIVFIIAKELSDLSIYYMVETLSY